MCCLLPNQFYNLNQKILFSRFVHVVLNINPIHSYLCIYIFRSTNGSLCEMDEGAQHVAAQCAYWLEGVLLVNKLFFFSVYFSSFDDYSYYTYCSMHFCMLANFFLENNKLITNPIGIGIVSSLLMLVKKRKNEKAKDLFHYTINFKRL